MSYESIAILCIGVVGMLLYIANTWDFSLSKQDKKINLINLLLTWVMFFLIAGIIQLMEEIAVANTYSADIQTLITMFYTASMDLIYVVSGYFMLYLFNNLLLYFGIDAFATFKRGKK